MSKKLVLVASSLFLVLCSSAYLQGGKRRIDRKYPIFWCPIDHRSVAVDLETGDIVDLLFSPLGTAVRITFTAENNDSEWVGQKLDSIAVVDAGLFTSNLVFTEGYSDPGDPFLCYQSPGQPGARSYNFTAPQTPEVFLELFGSAAGTNAWTLQNASFDSSTSAPHPVTGAGSGGGSLHLGPGAGVASASVEIDGLQAGRRYALTGWWYSEQVDVDDDQLSIEIQDLLPQIEVPQGLRFRETVAVGDTDVRSLGIRNSGERQLAILEMAFDNPDFAVSSETPFSVDPGTTQSVDLEFTPSSGGEKAGLLSIRTNDPWSELVQVAVTGYASSPTTDPDPEIAVFPQIAIGNGFEAVVFLTNDATTPWSGTLQLNQGNREDWSALWFVDGTAVGTGQAFEVSLQPQGTKKLTLTGDQSLQAGYLTVIGNLPPPSPGVRAALFYNYRPEGNLQTSTGVLPAESGRLFRFSVEKAASADTALAIVSNASVDAVPFLLSLSLWDSDGNPAGTTEVLYEGHFARFFAETFENLPEVFVGSLEVRAPEELFLVVLRQELTLTGFELTSLPALPLSP